MINFFKIKHIIASITILLLLFGCATPQAKNKINQIQQKKPCWVQHAECIKNKYPISAVGTGKTIKEATEDAIYGLAKQLSVHSYIKTNKEVSYFIHNMYQDYNKRIHSSSTLTTSETVKYWDSVTPYKDLDKTYHVLVYVKEQIINELTKLEQVKNNIKLINSSSFSSMINNGNILKEYIRKVRNDLENIDFNLLNSNLLTREDQSIVKRYSKTALENQLAKQEEKLITVKRLLKRYSNLPLFELKRKYADLTDSFINDIKEYCYVLKEKYNINIKVENGCKIFVTRDNKHICKEYCGEDRYIAINKNINLKELTILENLEDGEDMNIYTNKIKEQRLQSLILQYLIRSKR